MDTLKQRLDILLTANMITLQEEEILEEWVRLIKENSAFVDQEKLERMITHCAMMMKRQRDKTEFESLPDEIYESIKEHELYTECCSLFNKMNKIYQVDSKEERYIILHLCSCFSKE